VTLEETLQSQLRDAMRAGDVMRRDVIRQVLATMRNEVIAVGHPLSDDESMAIVTRLVNQHRDSISEFKRGNRPDLVAKEQSELDILLTYLPTQLERDEIVAAASEVIQRVGADGRKDQGKVMRELSPQLRGKADMRLVNEVVQELLGS